MFLKVLLISPQGGGGVTPLAPQAWTVLNSGFDSHPLTTSFPKRNLDEKEVGGMGCFHAVPLLCSHGWGHSRGAADMLPGAPQEVFILVCRWLCWSPGGSLKNERCEVVFVACLFSWRARAV